MAYRKFKRMRRFGGRRRRYSRRSFRRRVRRIAYGIAEKKYFEYQLRGGTNPLSFVITDPVAKPIRSVAGFVVNTTPTPRSLINMIGQGLSSADRIGNKIFVEYIQLSIFVEMDTALGAGVPEGTMRLNGCTMRYGVYYDKQAGGTNAPLTRLYTGVGGGGWSYGDFRDNDTLGKYKTLRDKQVRIAYTDTGAAGSGIPAIQEYIPIKREFTLTQQGVDASSTVNMVRNDVGFVLSCNHDANCYAWVAVRVCFRDA